MSADQIHSVTVGLAAAANKILHPDFIDDIRRITGTGSNAEIVIKINRRPEGDYRLTLKTAAVRGKRQHLCFTRLSP